MKNIDVVRLVSNHFTSEHIIQLVLLCEGNMRICLLEAGNIALLTSEGEGVIRLPSRKETIVLLDRIPVLTNSAW